MKFSEDYNPGSNVIRAYHRDGISVNGEMFQKSLVVAPNQIIPDWPVTSVDDLSTELLQELVEHTPEVILIGTGQQIQFPHPEIYAPIVRQRIGVEFMDTGAACRTYNILLSEERKVIAGIII